MMSMESPTRKRVEQARYALLHVHRALLEVERIRYERQHGRIQGSGALLQIVLNDPWFYWLRPLPPLIALLDEWVQADPPADDAAPPAERPLAPRRARPRAARLSALRDEWLEADPPADDAATRAELLLAQVRDRLRPDEDGADFQQRYHQLLQEEPTVAVAHAEVRKLINS